MPQDSIETPTSFSQLFAQQAHENREKTWIYYPEPITAEKYRCLTYGGADKLMSHLAALYQEIMPEATNETVSKTAPKLLDSPPMVVATMASNNVQCLLTGLASQRLGNPYIHISHLNSDIGIVSLLKSIDARVLIADSVFIDRAKSLALEVEGLHVISMIDFDPIDELKKPLRSFKTDTSSNELSKCCLIMHTSGTTNSAPKPMWHNYKGFLQTHPFMTGTTVLTTGLVYHGLGGGVALLIAFAANAMAFPLAKDCHHRTIPDVINSLRRLPNCNVLLLHPILVEALYDKYGRENKPELDYLRRLDAVASGGGKLSKTVADNLIDLGIHMKSVFGSTELLTFPIKNVPTADNWDSFVAIDQDRVEWEPTEDGLYELIVRKPYVLALNLGRPETTVYRTSDVFEEIPADSGQYVYVGRRDQMLIHTMGLNTNPVPRENSLRLNPLVEECQMVGQGQRGPLMLVELDWSKVTNEQDAAEEIWQEILDINTSVMAWSRIQHREALVILPKGEHLERCDKQTIRRGVNARNFVNYIDQGYQRWNQLAPVTTA